MLRRRCHIVRCLCALLSLSAAYAWSQAAPIIEVNADHPLYLFAAPSAAGDPQGHANQIVSAWSTLPDELKPYAAFEVRVDTDDASTRHGWLLAMLARLNDTNVPVFINVATENTGRIHPLSLVEQLVSEFSCVKGVTVSRLRFNRYVRFGGGERFARTPVQEWLEALIPEVAGEGKLVVIALDEVHWLRIMANAQCRSLYETIAEHSDFVIPAALVRDAQVLTQMSALLGLWLEGASASWGVAPSTAWYTNAGFVEPGIFGPPGETNLMPPAYYKAMLLNGVMTGATAYFFPDNRDLWYGSRPEAWHTAIYPLLARLPTEGLIARPEFIKRKVQVAYQLAPAASSEEFHLNLRDVDPVLDEGYLFRAAYGVERPGQVPELIPNTGRHYWIPIVSAHISADKKNEFVHTVGPGVLSSTGAWRELLAGYYPASIEGDAFVTRIGRGAFVMHTRENSFARQTFRIPEMPAPVRSIQAERTQEGVKLVWPFREGDIAWSVWRRALPAGEFQLLSSGLDDRQYLDTEYEDTTTAAYSVTALTSEKEAYEDAVNFGDYRLLSAVESRIAEEVVISPLSQSGASRPLLGANAELPEAQSWWPGTDDLEGPRQEVAEILAAMIVDLDEAIQAENLDGIMQRYDLEYADPQGWGYGYARRAYQWFFERYDFCRMDRQIREWDFERYDEYQEVRVLLYCRLTGVALTDSNGEYADLRVAFPRSDERETWITFSNASGQWRIVRTNPALPNFRDILAPDAGSLHPLPPAPDIYQGFGN
jgi:hypothetical protein